MILGGRIALITGATGNLGPVVVRDLAEAGASMVVTGRELGALNALRPSSANSDEHWLAVPADLTDPQATRELVEQALQRFGRVDVLVALAGGWQGGKTVVDSDLDTLNQMFQINLVTAYNACRAVLPGMLKQGWGRIITIGARSAVAGQARSAAYAASKAALIALTQSIALETRNQGVTANVLLLSTIDTPANRAAMPGADASRWVLPDQIAATIRFLASEEAGAISGATIPVYGRA